MSASSPTDGRPVGRLAPSPTGELHLGHARSFLLAWWSVRSRGGRVVLRIEDLDRARVRPGAVEACVEDLEWLGLDWDEGPHLQSTSLEAMHGATGRLVAAGLAYPCVCSRREIEASLSAPHADEARGELRYPGTCRGRFASAEEAERETGRTPGLRFRVPEGPVSWTDGRLGPREDDVASSVGDFLIARRDGVFAYQLAVVVDDARQGVTEVLRGDDLVPSTPRQLLLQQALGLDPPHWIHVPLVLDHAGARLAKRDRSLSLRSLREEGVDPHRIVAWAARSSGRPGAPLGDARDLIEGFSIADLPPAPVRLPPYPANGFGAARWP